MIPTQIIKDQGYAQDINMTNLNIEFGNLFLENGMQDGIHYAHKIQQCILPNVSVQPNLEQFVLFKPKDRVGGDIYWIENLNDQLFSICIDCTGHGVPGAMLSMMAFQILESIIKDTRIFTPGKILDVLHQKFIAIFGQKSIITNQGMDVSICVYNKTNKTLQYASAKGRILLQQGNHLLRLPIEAVSIGDLFRPTHKFQTHIIHFEHPSWLFQFSDGITDQFGGSINKKFKLKRLEDLILQADLSSKENLQAHLVREFKDWIGDRPQTDDITLIATQFRA